MSSSRPWVTALRWPAFLAVLPPLLLGCAGPTPGDIAAGPEASAAAARLPEGANIAFSVPGGGAMQIVVLAGAGPFTPVDAGWADQSHPAWAPDGLKIAFIANGAGSPELRVADLQTRSSSPLVTTTARGADHLPMPFGPISWSPNANLVAFSSPLIYDPDIWVVATDGTGMASTFDTGPGAQTSPSWAPDGQHIAFACQASATSPRHLCIADGTGQPSKEVTSGTEFDADPTWSPDGTRIAFSTRAPCQAQVDCLRAHIAVLTVEGGGVVALTSGSDDDTGPAWSPDGLTIAFTRNNEVWLMQADGRQQARLGSGSWPSWRP